MSSVKLFSGTNTKYLAQKIAEAYGTKLGLLSTQRFSDGELSPSFDESVRGYDVYLIQSTFPPSDNLLELLLMIDAAKRASVAQVTVVMPYFGYGRQDRKDKPRVSISAKLIANLLSAAGADRIVTCDLHAGQIQGFFDLPVDHLYASNIFVPYIQSLNLNNIIFAAPDVGAVGRARGYAKYFTGEIVVCDKYREKANEIASMQVIGNVKGADVFLVDDIVDTGGTICRAAQALKDKGAKTVRAACTHPLLSGNAIDIIESSVLVEMVVSDSIPSKNKSSKIKVLSVANLFAKAIRNIHDQESVSSLFL